MSREPRQPALPVPHPEGQHGVVPFGVMEGEAVGGGGGGTPAHGDGHPEPHRHFPLGFPLGQRAYGVSKRFIGVERLAALSNVLEGS